MTLTVSLLRVWFLGEELGWGPLEESAWQSHQLWFETLWIICGTLGVSVLFVAPVLSYSQMLKNFPQEKKDLAKGIVLFVWPVFNWVFLSIAQQYLFKKHRVLRDLAINTPLSKSFSLGSILTIILVLSHCFIWLFPYRDFYEYLLQGQWLIVLSLLQLIWAGWTFNWMNRSFL